MNLLTAFSRRFGQLGLATLLMALSACTTVKPPEVVTPAETPQAPVPKKVPNWVWPWAVARRGVLRTLG